MPRGRSPTLIEPTCLRLETFITSTLSASSAET